MKYQSIFTLSILLFFAELTLAQCPFDPTISGDTLLCPNSSGILKTQLYDSYQWYQRPWGGSTATPIAGATQQSLTVTESDMLNYFSVEATLNGCKETSPEVLLDGWTFLFPIVQHTGNYTFDPVTETFKVCKGDTMFLTLKLPYEKNITWFKNGISIPGETNPTYAVTESGDYTVEGAPAVCPLYIQPLGLTLPVTVENCSTDLQPESENTMVKIFPNPVSDWLHIQTVSKKPIREIEIFDIQGRSMFLLQNIIEHDITVPLSQLSAGTYSLKIKSGREVFLRKISKL